MVLLTAVAPSRIRCSCPFPYGTAAPADTGQAEASYYTGLHKWVCIFPYILTKLQSKQPASVHNVTQSGFMVVGRRAQGLFCWGKGPGPGSTVTALGICQSLRLTSCLASCQWFVSGQNWHGRDSGALLSPCRLREEGRQGSWRKRSSV